MRMEDMYDVIEDGVFDDGEAAFRLRLREGFILHGVEVAGGSLSKFRIDGNTELRNSWMLGAGVIRNSQLDSVILGRADKNARDHFVENSWLSSCHIKALRILLRCVNLNDVSSQRILFFGALGTPEESLHISKIRYAMSVRMFNTTYQLFKAFTESMG